MPKPLHGSTHYVPALDGLRALAVFLVIAYHLNVPAFRGGLLGVGVFFTLSGYLITLGLMSSQLRHGTMRLSSFWFRRFRRLIPAMLTTVAAVIVISSALEPDLLSTRGWEALSSVFYVNNWHNIATGTSYFDRFEGPGPLDHMWSLSIEEQFYLVWPLLLWALLKVLRKPRLVAAATVLLAAASYLLMATLATPGVDPTRIYEGTDTRAGGLLLGAALAIVVATRRHEHKRESFGPIVSFLFGAVGIGGIVALSVMIGQNDLALYRGGILALNLATVCALIAVLPPKGPWPALLGCAPLRWLGERSYGIYLWHMPAIYFLPDEWLRDQPVKAGALAVVISVLLAAVSWSAFENPIRRDGVVAPWRARRERPLTAWRPVTVGSTITLAATVAIGAPAALTDSGARGGGAAPAMTLDDGAGRATATTSAPPSSSNSETVEASSWVDAPEDTPMSCSEVYHVGDSTSIGMFDAAQLPESALTASERYLERGAGAVEPSVFGARATTVGWEGDGVVFPSALQSVQELLAAGVDDGACWVIATGVNDAANADAARDYGYDTTGEIETNIRTMVELLDGYRVLWPTAATGNPSNPYYANSNMEEFNASLRKVAAEHHNVVVFDWAKEARENQDWFLAGDEVHYNAYGNDQRAKRFADALATAFPKGVEVTEIPLNAQVASDGTRNES